MIRSSDLAPGKYADCPEHPLLTNLLWKQLSHFPKFSKAAHVSAQSFPCHNDEFKTNFDNSLFNLILISETRLKTVHSDSSVELSGYYLYRNDRLHKCGGGNAVYAKSHLPSYVLHISDTSIPGRSENMFIDVSLNGIDILVGACYRAPNIGFRSHFKQTLLSFMARYRHIIIMGDLNTDLLGPTSYNKTLLTTMFESCNITVFHWSPPTIPPLPTLGWISLLSVNRAILYTTHSSLHQAFHNMI